MMDNNAVTIEMTETKAGERYSKIVESTPVVVAATSAADEETTEGFVLDVIEGDEDKKKKKKKKELTDAEQNKLYEENPYYRPRTAEEIAEEQTLCFKIKDVLSWMVIAFLVCLIIGIVIWHFAKPEGSW